ncbi:hypothetical protein GCM10022630_36940 [Thermobifida alba]
MVPPNSRESRRKVPWEREAEQKFSFRKKGSRTGAGEREATTTGRPETPDRTRPGREQKTGRAEPTRHRRTGHVHRVGQATNPPRPQTRKQAPAGTPN